MKFLLTNDDGIHAPGLESLAVAVEGMGARLIVAPNSHQSGASHQATTDRALELTRIDDQRLALDGTPVDCARVGILHLASDIDWVLSGINEGGNLGCDVFMSGTVAAVREAALLGKPGIAISQYRRRASAVDWQRAARWSRRVIELLLGRELPVGTFWNVNLPDPQEAMELPPIEFCPMDPHPLAVAYQLTEGRLHYQGDYHLRRREKGHDVALCFGGAITVTHHSLR